MTFDEVQTPEQLLTFMQHNIKYEFAEDYKLCTGEQLLEKGYGVCWDYVELQRAFFERQGTKHKTFYMDALMQGGNTHTFTLFFEDGKTKWLECSWGSQAGIREYESVKDALDDISKRFKDEAQSPEIDTVEVFQYQKPEGNLGTNDFINHCRNGERYMTPNEKDTQFGD